MGEASVEIHLPFLWEERFRPIYGVEFFLSSLQYVDTYPTVHDHCCIRTGVALLAGLQCTSEN